MTTTTVLGEFGRHGGAEVVEVILVRGHSAEIRALWRELDDADADAVEQDRIFRRLRAIGAVRPAK
jgi:CelD/BcsL family acetyltransferase involved in cellulose biosynthesis